MRKKIVLILFVLFANLFFLNNASYSTDQKPQPGSGNQEQIISEQDYLKVIKLSVEKYKNIYPLDPFLVLSIIKAESSFKKYEISSSGAAGPVQLMPFTAEEMGMRVFSPYYYQVALDEREISANYYKKADEAMGKINFKNSSEENEKLSIQVRLNKEIGSWHEAQAKSLLQRYKEELSSKVMGKTNEELMDIDQRFIVPLAIDACVRILANNAKKLNGDKREIASSYNAGLGTVINSGGIPFLKQTVVFQNRVIKFYREYTQEEEPSSSP